MEMKMFKIKKRFRKGGLRINPNTSWEIIVYFALVMILVSFVFGFYLFNKTNKEFIASPENTKAQIKTVKKERIQRALEYFFEKEKRSAEILNSPVSVVDPSL